MNIQSVEVVTHFKEKGDAGKPIPVLKPHFVVTENDSDETVSVPFDPMNRDYVEIKEWYESHKKPGFKFDFKKHKPI